MGPRVLRPTPRGTGNRAARPDRWQSERPSRPETRYRVVSLTVRRSDPTLPSPLPSAVPSHPRALKPLEILPNLRLAADDFLVMAGPCAVESRAQILEAARGVAAAGAAMLRGGAYKPRTSPRSFQGLGRQGLEFLREAFLETGLPVVTEVLDPRDVELVAEHAAMLQVGSRSMQNFPLLREVGRSGRPVLLKRGAAATIEEFLLAAEYVYAEGNDRVILCERGVRGFDPCTRNLLDLAAVPILQSRTDAPVVVDPSHATGRAELVPVMARAALAAGADGILVEVHPEPESALSDREQALRLAEFGDLVDDLARWLPLVGRQFARSEHATPTPEAGAST